MTGKRRRRTRKGEHEQPDWLALTSDLLEPIAQKSPDAITGLTSFRSVCRTWRAAVGQVPRLLLPACECGSTPHRAGSKHALVFPLSHGWSIVVDALDASSHLSHLMTGATAPLPKINAVRDGKTSSDIRHITYVHHTDDKSARRGEWFWGTKIKIHVRSVESFYRTYQKFSDGFRFALHVPPGNVAARTDNMMIMMCHNDLHGPRKSIVLCRPGDAAWTKLADSPSYGWEYVDLACFQGKIYGLERNGSTSVFDAKTLEFLHSVNAPQSTSRLFSVLYPRVVAEPVVFDYFNFVALPSKILLIVTSVESLEPEGFTFFELVPDIGMPSWRKVTEDAIGGNYDVFMDCYHATFSHSAVESGTRIYYVLGRQAHPKTSAYCYEINGGKLECVYRSPDDRCKYSTKPSWFVP